MLPPRHQYRSFFRFLLAFSQHAAQMPCLQRHAGTVCRGLSYDGNIGTTPFHHTAQQFRLPGRIADMEAQQELVSSVSTRFTVPVHQGMQLFLKASARFRSHAEETFPCSGSIIPYGYFP